MYETTVTKIQEVSNNTFSIYFSKPKGFKYQAGQYAKLICKTQNQEKISRPMSFSSAPCEEELSFTMRLSESPFKKAIARLQTGDMVEIMAPLGKLSTNKDKKNIFIAGGIGITPFRSIIIEEKNNNFPYPIHLFYSEKTQNDAAFIDEFFAIDNKNFTFTPTLTKEDWNNETGRIHYQMLQKYFDPKDTNLYFTIIGTTDMVFGIKKELLEQKVKTENIQVELFGNAKKA